MSRNGQVHTLTPTGPVSFRAVTDMLRARNPAEAFTHAAEVLLDNFQALKGELGAAPLLKLAIDMHKHGLFCEVAMDKTRSAHDAAAYDLYQKYLAGDSDTPVAAGLRSGAPAAPAPNVDEETEDAEDPEQHRQ